MKIDEIVNQSGLTLEITDPHILNVEGAIAIDDDPLKVRIYPDPKNRNRYILIDKSSIFEHAVELHEDYVHKLGLTGFRLFRLSVKRGSPVMIISVEHHRLGETISAKAIRISANWYPGECQDASDCPDGCCTFDSTGTCYCDRCCLA